VLVYWRNRIRTSPRLRRVFEAVRQVVEATGVPKAHIGTEPVSGLVTACTLTTASLPDGRPAWNCWLVRSTAWRGWATAATAPDTPVPAGLPAAPPVHHRQGWSQDPPASA
jgi:hypothetical protein